MDVLADTIRSIGRESFHECMRAFMRLYLDFDNIVVIKFDQCKIPIVIFKDISGPDVFRLIDKDYLTGAYLLDPVYHYHLEGKPSGIFRLLDIAPDQFKRSRYYEWYYGRIGIIDEISIIAKVSDNTTITISMGKDSSTNELFSQKNYHSLNEIKHVFIELIMKHYTESYNSTAFLVGKSTLSDELSILVTNKLHINLSKRQAEVALMILRGHSSSSIGLNLDISSQTVKVFRKQLYKKCNISSQAELFSIMMPLLTQINKS